MDTSKRLLLFLFVAGFCLLGLNAGLARAATVDVTVNDDGFQPSYINIHKGDTVRWTNTGTVVHSVTSCYYTGGPLKGDDGFIDSGPMAPAAIFEQTFAFHGYFQIYDKYNANAAAGGGNGDVSVDYEVFISPESSSFSELQGFDLAFHFRNGHVFDQWSPFNGQCSIFFDGVELGNCLDVFADLNFHSYTGMGYTFLLTIPPGTLPIGRHSLSIKAATMGQAFSDTAWYTMYCQECM